MLASCNVGCDQGISSGDLRKSSPPVFVALLHLYDTIGPRMVSAAQGQVRLTCGCHVQVMLVIITLGTWPEVGKEEG